MTLPANKYVSVKLAKDGRLFGFITLASNHKNESFILDPKGLQKIAYPGAAATDLSAVTGRGDFGTYRIYVTNGIENYGFVRIRNVFHSIPLPNSSVLGGFALIGAANDNGDFVGYYSDAHANIQGFVATCAADQQPCTQ